MSSTSTIARNGLRTFVTRGVVVTMAALTGIITARWLGPAGKGVYGSAQLLFTVGAGVPLGIGTAITYALTKQRRPWPELLPAVSVALLVLMLASWALIAGWGFLRGWTPLLGIIAAGVPAQAVIALQPSFYISLGRIRNMNIQGASLALATTLAVLFSVTVLHGNALTALTAWLVCTYAAALVVVSHALRLGRGPRQEPIGKTLGELLRFGSQTSANVFLGRVNYRIDSFILIALLGAAPFGIYSIAVNFGELLFMLTWPVTAAVTRDIGIRTPAAAAAMTAKVNRTSTALVVAVSAVAFVIGPWAIDFVYGTRFHDAGTALRILLPGIVAISTSGQFQAYFNIQMGKPAIVSANMIAMIVAQALLCLILVPRMGMNGAAVASTATYCLGAVMNTAWFCRQTGTPVADVWWLRRSDVVTVREAAREFAARLRPDYG